MQRQKEAVYEFGPFRIDAVKRLLLRDGSPVHIAPKAFDTLLILVERNKLVVEKDELIRTLWPDSFVEEINLPVHISALRKALGDNKDEHRYIVTIPRRGYSFVAEVNQPEDEQSHSSDHIITAGTDAGESALQIDSVKDVVPDVMPDSRRWKSFSAIASFAALIMAVAFFYFSFTGKSNQSTAATTPRSIAVLPFKILGSDGDQYLGAGIADALITKLSNVKQIAVRPTSAVLKYEDLQRDELVAGRELEVDLLLSGVIQKVGSEIRVTVQLVRVADGIPIWAGQFDQNFTDHFTIQDTIARKVAEAMMLRLTENESKQLAKQYTQNTKAYQLYLQGRYYWNKRTAQGLEKAVEHFKRAVEIDPEFALAFAGLADCYILISDYGQVRPKDSYPQAKAAATRALQMDDSLAEAHTSLASVHLFYDWDFAGAEREFLRAIELDPNHPTTDHWYSWCLIVKGRLMESRTKIDRALELDPASLAINTALGKHFHYARQYEEALEQYGKVLDMDPNYVPALHNIGLTYAHIGRYEEAIAVLKKAAALSQSSSAALAHVYAVSGKAAEARKILAELEALSKRSFVSPFRIAMVYAGLGKKDQAFEWLEKAFEERDKWLIFLKLEPIFDRLHPDPRFRDLLRRVGIEQ